MQLRQVLLVAAIVAAPLNAVADSAAANKAKAREAYRLASQSYDLGEYRDALAKFKEAYRYYEEPSFLFNIGQCHRQLGERPEAIRFFRTYLSKSPDAPNRTEVEQMIAKLETEQAHDRAATVTPPPPTAVGPPPTTAKTETTPAILVGTPAPSANARREPVYKKWWLWTAVGVVVVGGAVGLAVGLQPSTPKASTTFGTIQPF